MGSRNSDHCEVSSIPWGVWLIVLIPISWQHALKSRTDNVPIEVGSMLLETVLIIFSVKLAAFFTKWNIIIITVRNPVRSARGIGKWDIMIITL